MRKWLLVGGGVAALVVGFLLFRPDTLFTQVVADETLEEAFATTTTGVTPTRFAVTTSTTALSGTTQPVTSTISPVEEPLALSTGQLTGIDHRAAGTVTVYEQGGRYVLRFEDDTDIQNGPDLYVWMLPATSYESGDPPEYLDLGTLKGTVGGQNYELPAEFDPATHRAVLIWCLRFAVPFATAPLG